MGKGWKSLIILMGEPEQITWEQARRGDVVRFVGGTIAVLRKQIHVSKKRQKRYFLKRKKTKPDAIKSFKIFEIYEVSIKGIDKGKPRNMKLSTKDKVGRFANTQDARHYLFLSDSGGEE